MNRLILTRFGEPTKYDHGEYGTICKVVKQDKTEVYAQLSLDEENPQWSYMGSFVSESDDEIVSYIDTRLIK